MQMQISETSLSGSSQECRENVWAEDGGLSYHFKLNVIKKKVI